MRIDESRQDGPPFAGQPARVRSDEWTDFVARPDGQNFPGGDGDAFGVRLPRVERQHAGLVEHEVGTGRCYGR